MGFFSNLLKNEAKKLVSDVVDNVVDNTLGQAIKDHIPGQQSDSHEYNDSNNSNNIGNSGVSQTTSKESGEAGLRARLESVLNQEWSDYQIRRDIPAAEFGASERARDYSYGLYKDGQPKAMFLVITSKNHYLDGGARLAQSACKAKGIPCMNFFSHLPNTTDYISSRLKQNIQ